MKMMMQEKITHTDCHSGSSSALHVSLLRSAVSLGLSLPLKIGMVTGLSNQLLRIKLCLPKNAQVEALTTVQFALETVHPGR